MRRFRLFAVLAIGISLACGPTGAAPARGQDAEGAARLVEDYTLTWNGHDAGGVAAYFTEDADMIMGNGPIITGREDIEASWRTYFSRIDAGRKGHFEIESSRTLAPDAVLLNVNSTTAGSDASGKVLPTRLARGTWVVIRKDGKWLIAAMRGQPAAGENRTRAGTDKPED